MSTTRGRRARIPRALPWWAAAAFAGLLSLACFTAGLVQRARAPVACAELSGGIVCPIAHAALETMALFAGIGFLLLAALFLLAGMSARVARAASG